MMIETANIISLRSIFVLSWFFVTTICGQNLYENLQSSSDDTPVDVSRRTKGRRFTPIPLVNYTSDDGMGYGLRMCVYDYDSVTVPYRRALKAQYFVTTEGKWAHVLSLDYPNFLKGHRFDFELAYDKLEFANYYGELSNHMVDSLRLSKSQRTFRQATPSASLTWIYDLHGPWRLRSGVSIRHTSVKPNADSGNILKELKPVGYKGGVLWKLDAAMRYDTRDNYINSTRGILEELHVEYKIGGAGDYQGWLASYEHRHFIPITPSVVAGYRLAADQVFGQIPFYDELKLGGEGSVRGMPSARRRGQGRFLVNTELRWRGIHLSDRRNMMLGVILFTDAGQIYKRKDGSSLIPKNWHAGYGGGLRFYWHSTIIRTDYGISEGGSGLYILFSQVF